VQRAHLQEAPDARRGASRRERSGEFHVRTRERRATRLVQYSHEVHYGGRAGKKPRERHAIEHVGFDHFDRRQQDQVLGRLAAARRHHNVVPRGGQARHQVAANKSAAAHDHDTLHRVVHSVLAAIGSITTAPRGATTPKRAVSDCGAPPNACAYIIEFASTFFT
jgi:hypothetical protein